MDTERICKECGAPLSADAPEGLCPKCLMRVAFGTQPGIQTATNPITGTGAFDTLPDPGKLTEYFPQLEILELLGHGGMGAVYKARQPGLDRLVALKILPLQAGAEPGFAERFNREARALAKLNHPNIVAVYDFGQTHGLHYLVMELVDGPNLRQIERADKLAAREALQIIPQICEALQYAHDEGVVHRDIKPENVLLDKKGRVKIADFGLAKILGREPFGLRLTGAKDVMGTPHYMAPEQVEHPQAVDHRADIYSLGVVFYEMLTGELPLGKFAPPSQKVQVDVRLDEVVLRTLEKEPERRYQHASQVKSDVETIASSNAPTPGSTSEKNRPLDTSRQANLNEPWAHVKGPAIGLAITGVLNWIAIPLVLMLTALVDNEINRHLLQRTLPFAALILGGLIFAAGLKMKHLEGYVLALIGSILAILVAPGNLIGLPIGIWALVVLTRREVRAAFAAHARGDLGSALSPTPASPVHNAWKPVAVAAAALMFILAIPVGAVLVAIALPAWSRARTHPEATLLTRPGGPVQSAVTNFQLESASGGGIRDGGAGGGAALVVPPVVVNTVPESGSTNVDPALTELLVTFSKPMKDGCWSWMMLEAPNFPEMTGQPRYLGDQRTCVVPVKLQAGKLYATWINSDESNKFQDLNGTPAVPYLLIFQTRK